jgi:exopolyphosphatase/guanosine-5'-triphosphate,3'-diphosphate pyrophosphatase
VAQAQHGAPYGLQSPKAVEPAVEKSDAPRERSRPGHIYAALDLGTNNCRLLIAKPDQGSFRVLDSFSRTVRLGEGLNQTGELSDAAMQRAIDAIRICAVKMKRRGVTSARAIATQACRTAKNGPAFIARVAKETGLHFDIISPLEEARLAARGVTPLLDRTDKGALVFDIGGGSTELIWLDLREHGRAPKILRWGSMPLGVVIAGIHLGLERYERSKVDGTWLKRDDIVRVIAQLKDMRREGRAAHPCIGPERAELVIPGLAIFEAIFTTWTPPRLRVADRGLREGMLLALMEGSEPARKQKRRRKRRGRKRRRQGGASA